MLTTFLLALAAQPAGTPEAPRGAYVEGRTASILAGACHFGAQYTTQGREAVLGFSFEAGEHARVSLAGVELAVVVAADKNLAEPGAVRRSVVHLDSAASAAQRRAALAWLCAEHAAVLGEVVAVVTVPVAVEVDAARDSFRLAVGDAIELAGRGLPDRECCTMPASVWYAPEVPLASRVVGDAEVFRCDAQQALGRRWTSSGENEALFGRFGPRAAPRPTE